MIILRDTREKKPWSFDWYDDVSIWVGKVEIGDYTIKGFESLVTIERKASTGELAVNLGKTKARFMKELRSMQEYPYRYIICEFPESHLDCFPKDSGIPYKDWGKLRVNKNYLKHMVKAFREEFGITVIFCDGPMEAQDKAMEIFRQVINDQKEDKVKSV